MSFLTPAREADRGSQSAYATPSPNSACEYTHTPVTCRAAATDLPNSFADRQFYDDWWNSTSWDEFSRKWNRPVHTFLLRHVYASSMSSYKLTRQSAMFFTFLLSAAAHELVMAVVTKKIRFYLFALQVRPAIPWTLVWWRGC